MTSLFYLKRNRGGILRKSESDGVNDDECGFEICQINLPDYKWYCFDGEPKYCQVIQNRSTKDTIDFYDSEWNHLEFIGLSPEAVHAAIQPSNPAKLSTQLAIAKQLSKNLPFVRIDLFEVGSKVYFGEITFYPLSGMGRFKPDQWNQILGSCINLHI